jgi:hypothetical protein
MEFAPAPGDEPESDSAVDPDEPHIRWMTPRPNVKFRVGLAAVLLVLLALSPGVMQAKFVGLLTITFLVGSYRRSYLDADAAYVQLTVCFIPLKRKKYRLRKFNHLEIMLEEPAGWWTFFLFSPVYWIWMRALDFAIPWLGGLHQLWLSNPKRKVLIWQGVSDEDFQQNLKQLETATGLRAERSGGY